MSQDVGKLRCQIAQVPLYFQFVKASHELVTCPGDATIFFPPKKTKNALVGLMTLLGTH